MEGDAEVSYAPVCIRCPSETQSRSSSRSSVTGRHRHDGRGGKERRRMSGRMQVAVEREEGQNRRNLPMKSRRTTSQAKRERGGGAEECSRVEAGREMTKLQTRRAHRGEGLVTPPVLHIQDRRRVMPEPDLPPSQSVTETEPDLPPSQSVTETEPDLPPSQSVMETESDLPPSQSVMETESDLPPSQSLFERETMEPPENPPPMKRWVIGPFFQSFKSKMASFTEIVMSPVRFFKPSCPSAPSNTPPDLQNPFPDSVNGTPCNSHNGPTSKEETGGALDIQRPLEAKSKNEDHADSGSPQPERQICGGEVGEKSGHLHQPQTPSAPADSSGAEQAQLVVPSVRRLHFGTMTKAGGFDEEESLHAEKQNPTVTPHIHRLRDCDTFPRNKEERLRKSPCVGQCSQLAGTKSSLDLDPAGSLTSLDSSHPESPRTRYRSSLYPSSSKKHQSGKRAHLQRQCSKSITPRNICPNRLLKRSPSYDLFTHESPKKAPISSSSEALGFCEDKCSLGDEPPGLEPNTSGCSNTLSASFYFTPSLSLQAKEGDLGLLEAGEDGASITTCMGTAAHEMHSSLGECVVLLPSKTPVTTTDSPGQDSVQDLADNLVGTREMGGEPGKQNLVQIPAHILEPVQPRPPLRGLQHGGIVSSVETPGEPKICPEKNAAMRKNVEVKRGGKIGKMLNKKRNYQAKEKNELLIVTDGDAREEGRSGQNSRIRDCASQVQDTDLLGSRSSRQVVGKNSQDSCLMEAKRRGSRRNDQKMGHPSVTDIAPTVEGKCQDPLLGSSLEFKDCTTGNSSKGGSMTASKAISQGKNATSVNCRKLRSCVITLENIRHSPRPSNYDSVRITTETRNKEEDAAGIKESETVLKDARPKYLRKERQHFRQRKRELSPGIDTGPLLNRKCLATQKRIQGAMGRTTVPSEVPKESERSQGHEPQSQSNHGRLRRRLTNHPDTQKNIRQEQWLLKETVEKGLTGDMQLEIEATHLGNESSPFDLETQAEAILGGNSPVRTGRRPQAQPRMHTPKQISRKREKRQEGRASRTAKHKLLEADDDEDLKFGKVHRPVSKEVPQERRVKLKQRDGMGIPDGSQERKSCFRAMCGKKEGFTDKGELSKEPDSFEKPGCDSLPNPLLRSYSCPEIPSFLNDCPWTSPLPPPAPRGRHHRSPLPLPLPPSSAKRTRRHTVCSLEVEREIAPLCLRKEVHPTGRAGQYFNPISSVSSTSFTALASCFLSSPLAFLSRRPEQSTLNSSTSGISACSCDVTFSSSSDATPSTSSSVSSLVCHVLPGSTSSSLPSVSQPGAWAGGPEGEPRQAEEEEEGTCFTPQPQPIAPPDERSLSDSETKAGSAKQGERGKVSRIKIRKTPPKAPSNLTPMGLPRPARLKKKEFTLEEIYTNKNFHKPAEGRLETIFEVPTSNCDGSLSLIGSRRLKRLVKFPELGVARKPRKPLSGVGKGGSRKTGDSSVIGRTRRGQAPKAKEGPSHAVEDPDSLLCSKLHQLDAWVDFDQEAV